MVQIFLEYAYFVNNNGRVSYLVHLPAGFVHKSVSPGHVINLLTILHQHLSLF